MRGLVVCLVVVSGCWAERRVDDVFTESEWSYLQTFRIDRLEPTTCTDVRCESIARFGQQLFFEPGFSGPLKFTSSLGQMGDTGKVACVTCHDPSNFFVDARTDNAQSLGAGWTKRNAPGLVDVAHRTQFTWSGQYPALDNVFELALEKPMNQPKPYGFTNFVNFINANYLERYEDVFPGQTSAAQIYANAASAIGVYERQLVSGPSAFDLYLSGGAEIDDAAKRGAKLFIGKAFCTECHDGPLFTDDKFHVTGVAQRVAHNTEADHGRSEITFEPLDDGRYRTPTLRHVAKTAPYMHAGQLQTLRDVVEFYRWGGDTRDFFGSQDPRIVPLEIDDNEARDLEAFLLTLTGAPVDTRWTVKP